MEEIGNEAQSNFKKKTLVCLNILLLSPLCYYVLFLFFLSRNYAPSYKTIFYSFLSTFTFPLLFSVISLLIIASFLFFKKSLGKRISAFVGVILALGLYFYISFNYTSEFYGFYIYTIFLFSYSLLSLSLFHVLIKKCESNQVSFLSRAVIIQTLLITLIVVFIVFSTYQAVSAKEIVSSGEYSSFDSGLRNCNKIDERYLLDKNACFTTLAIKERNVSVCSFVKVYSSVLDVDKCVRAVVASSQDINICYPVSEENLRSSCLFATIDIANYTELAYCNQFDSTELRGFCKYKLAFRTLNYSLCLDKEVDLDTLIGTSGGLREWKDACITEIAVKTGKGDCSLVNNRLTYGAGCWTAIAVWTKNSTICYNLGSSIDGAARDDCLYRMENNLLFYP